MKCDFRKFAAYELVTLGKFGCFPEFFKASFLPEKFWMTALVKVQVIKNIHVCIFQQQNS